MADARQALDAMAAAESVARNVIAVERLPFKAWARDRVRLADLHRETLALHLDVALQRHYEAGWRPA